LPNEATHIAVDNAGRAPRLAQALARIRWQIFGGGLVVLGCPTAGAVVFASDAVDMIAISNGALASALAMLTGYVGARRLVVFPGVHVASLSLPAFVGSYGGVGVGLVVGGAVKLEGQASGRDTVEGDAKRTAKEAAEELKAAFEKQGWI